MIFGQKIKIWLITNALKIYYPKVKLINLVNVNKKELNYR